jgi:hypothetical protein
MLNATNLPSLAERRLRTILVMMYKVSFHLVAVPSDILIASDTRTRKYHPLTYSGKCKLLKTQTFILPIHNTTVEPTPYKYA